MADTHNMVLVSIDWLDSLATQIKALQGERDEAVRLLRHEHGPHDCGYGASPVCFFLARIGDDS